MLTDHLPQHEIVLLGVGHTNAHVLKMWRMQPIADARLTCVSNFPTATYSGMLPGVLAEQYPRERMEIDLVRLCAAANARLILGNVTGIDRSEQRLLFDDRPSIPYSLMSIGIGSVPARQEAISAESVVPIKPMQTLLHRLEQRLDECVRRGREPLQIVVVGAGAGGVEIAFCLPNRLRVLLGHMPFTITLVSATDQVIGGVSEMTAKATRRELESRGVHLLLNRRVVEVGRDQIVFDNGDTVSADVVLWATNAVAAPLLSRIGLPTDERGFLLTRPTLQTVGDDSIFAVGDSGTLAESPTPKAGVYAVRQGPVLWNNLQRSLHRQPLEAYRPQRSFLKLFNLGDGRAIGEYRGITLRGAWVWRLKDRIDGRFMDMYQIYEPMPMAVLSTPAVKQVRCAGCGGKVGGSVLSRVLQRLDVPPHENVLLGLEAPDDAAIVRLAAGRAMNVTVDFFAAPFDDPYTVGRLAALNSASDCYATGARPFAALAAATIPVGKPRQQEQLLFELLAGALYEFRPMGATLVGGHTIEGPQTTIGFTMLAEQGDPPRTKGQLRVGDVLVLTKPLGTGVLLAAHMQAKLRAAWWEPLVHSMLLSNQYAAELCAKYSVSGLTDVTGFGLAGHLLEMLRPSGVAAQLSLAKLPLLPGAAQLFDEGLESTLAPANRAVEIDMHIPEPQRKTAACSALFDPQTCGGLLLGVSEEHAERLLKQLAQLSQVPAAVIGRIVPHKTDEPRLQLSLLRS